MTGTRVLVCGSRDWDDYPAVRRQLDGMLTEARDRWPHYQHIANPGICSCLTVIEGGQQTWVPEHREHVGADFYAADWAERHRVGHEQYPADWEAHGRAAGPIRNAQMLSVGKPDLVIAFSSAMPVTRGTADMIAKAQAAGVPVYLITKP